MKNNFSVILTTYRLETVSNLSESLISLLEQSVLPKKIYLVFDGYVPDEQINLVSHLEKIYMYKVDKIFLKNNVGRAQARNTALAKINEKFTAIMDSDDISHTRRFEEQLSVLYENPNIDIVASLSQEFKNSLRKKNYLLIKKCPKHNEEIKKKLIFSCCVSNPSVIMKTEVLKKIGGFPDVKFTEDYFLFLKLINSGYIFHCIQKPLIFVRIYNEQIIRRSGIGVFVDELKFRITIQQLGYVSFHINVLVIFLLFVRRLVPVKVGFILQNLWRRL